MKNFLIVILLGACSYLGFLVFQKNQEISHLIANSDKTGTSPSNYDITIVSESEDGSRKSVSTRTKTTEKIKDEGNPLKRIYNQFFDSEKAFAEDQLFAVMDKKKIRSENYTDHFDKNPFGNPKTKTHPAVYILRCLGRETRENYLFIVDFQFYDAAKIHQKFTKAEMSNFEFYLSEEKLERTIFSRRFRGKMID